MCIKSNAKDKKNKETQGHTITMSQITMYVNAAGLRSLSVHCTLANANDVDAIEGCKADFGFLPL